MKKIILLLALALPVALSAQDTIIRSFAATCTFQNFVLTPSGRYSGTLLVNDQTNTYRGDSVKVNDLVYAPSATLYVIDTVSSKNRFTATVIIRRISGKNAAPTGVGDVFRPTPNYKFYGFTPDNQNGLPSQAQFIKLTGIINRLDSLIYAVASASGGVMDGDKGDIIISSGGGVYTIDSLAVTKGKIAAAAVDSTKIGTSAIATSNISNGAVTNAKVGVGVVTTNPVSSGIGFLPMYAATLDGNDSLTNSIVRQSSSKIGIGITPDSTFTVDGSGRFVSPVAASKFIPTGNVPTGNGMYLPQANNVAFSANGVERLRLSNIITANGLFNVVDSIVPIISLDRSNLPNNQRIKFLTSNSDYSLSAGQVNGSGNYQSQMTIDSSGNVGIGTPFPATRLHVQGQLTVSDLTKSGNSRGIVAYQSDGTIDTIVIGGAIELVNDTLTVKASGIDSNMLASSSVTWVKLAQAVKDSITAGGGGGGGVTSITAGTGLTGGTITTSGTIAADTNFLVTVNDTASMLLPYLRDADTTAMLLPYLRDADTTAMLLPYLKKLVDSLSFVTTYEGVAVSGEMIWNNQSGTVHLGMAGDIEMPIGQAEAHMIRNTTGSQIAKGKVVYISGASGQRPLISLADADSESTSSGTFGITAEAIDNNDTGFVFVSGYIHGINTDTISPGSALWLDTIPGGFTTSKPVAPIHAVLVGYSITQANNGTIFVKVQNGYELGELHDVNVSGAVNGNLLRYNSSLSIWEDAQADSASIATSAIKTVHIADSAVTSIKLASASVGLNTATTSGTLPVSKGGTGLTTFGGAGRVPYSTGATGTGLQFDTLFRVFPANSNFFFGQNTGAAITTGLFNNFIGGDAGRETTIGNFNNFLGSSAGEKNTTGSSNQFIGNATGANNTTGNSNIFIGNSTGNENRTGSFNYFIGNSAGRNNRNGDMNIFIGRQAGYNTVDTLSGSNNIGIGALAGDNIKFGASKNIAIGDSIDYPIADGNKQLTIGNLIFGVSMDSTGTAIPVNGKVGILNNNPSTALDVNGVITATNQKPLILRRDASANDSSIDQVFTLKNSSGTYTDYAGIAGRIVRNNAGTTAGALDLLTADSAQFGIPAIRATIDQYGRFGIGTTLPSRTLHVNGTARITNLVTENPTLLVGANSAGDLNKVVLGTGLTLSNDTLNASGGGSLTDGDKTDITVSNSGATWTIDSAAVTGAKTNFAGRAGDATRLLGAQTDGTTDTVQVGTGLTLSGGVLSATGGGGGVTTFSAGSTGFTPNSATSGAVTLAGTLDVDNGGTGATTLSANKVLVGNGTSAISQPAQLHWDATNNRLGINESSPISDLHLHARSGGIIIEDSLTATAGPSIYVTGPNQTTSGANASEFFFMVGGPNSGSTTDGPLFGLRGSSYTRFSNQRGFMFFYSGEVTGTASGLDGTILFHAPKNEILFRTGTTYSASDDRMRIIAAGQIGVGVASPTAAMHFKAGTASASSAPIKFTSGTNMSTPEAGAVEWDGTNLFVTNSSASRRTVNQGFSGSATLDFPSTNAQLSADLTITVTGAADGDVVSVGVPNASVNANTNFTAWVSAANTVTVRFNNYSSGTVDPASGTFKVFVTKF